MKAIITVLGRDCVGIIAKVSNYLSDSNINILDISQTIMQDIFTMIMLVDTKNCSKDISNLSEELNELSNKIGVSITIQHEDIFNSMHRI